MCLALELTYGDGWPIGNVGYENIAWKENNNNTGEESDEVA